MVKIEDVIVPSKGIGKYFSLQCLNISLSKSSEATPSFYWSIRTAMPYAVDEVQVEIPGTSILEGNLTMTKEEYALWGSDDSYPIEWALGKLGFVEVIESPAE